MTIQHIGEVWVTDTELFSSAAISPSPLLQLGFQLFKL